MDISLSFFTRYFFSKRAGAVIRSMARLCWFATLIGVFSLIVVSSVMNGFNRSIRNKLLSVEPHLILSGDSDEVDAAYTEINRLPPAQLTLANAYYKQDVILRTVQDGRFAGAVIKALPPNAIYYFLNQVRKLNLKSGDVRVELSPESAQLEPGEILIGSDLARELNIFEGDEVMIVSPESLLGPIGEVPRYERMRVRSLFTTEFSEVDSKLILFNLPQEPLRFQSQVSGESGLEIYLQKPEQFVGLKQKLQSQFKTARIESWADRNRSLFFSLKLEKTAMTTFLALSVLITCFSLVTVLIMLISQKRKDIGLLMAIGYSKTKTSRLFLKMGLLLSGLGLFVGLGLGILVSWLIEKYPLEILPDIYYDSSLPSEINWLFVVGATIFCVFIAWFAAFWPVRLYLHKSPAENLRPQMSE